MRAVLTHSSAQRTAVGERLRAIVILRARLRAHRHLLRTAAAALPNAIVSKHLTAIVTAVGKRLAMGAAGGLGRGRWGVGVLLGLLFPRVRLGPSSGIRTALSLVDAPC